MPEYAYIAVNETGREVRGRIEAGRPEEVREKLRRSGLYPVNIVEGKADAAASPGLFAGRRHWKRADLVQVTMQLSHLLEAGMPVDKALEVLARHNRKPAVRTVLRQMLEEVRAGQGLADVIAKRQELFPRLYIHMVRAGEIGGRLEEILANLARYLESEARRWSQVRSMLIYPVFVMAMAVLAMVIVLTVIMPQIEQVFADFEQALPVPTLVLVGMSRRLARHWPLLLAGAVLPVFALRLALRRPAWRLRWDQAKLRLPLIGDIMQKLVAARVTRTLGVMLQGGVPMLDALTIAAGAGGNTWVANCVEEAAAQVRDGAHLAMSLGGGPFPAMALEMIALGEETGQLEAELLKVADTYDYEADAALKSIMSLLEPAIIAIVGLFLGFVIISVIGPVFNLNAGL